MCWEALNSSGAAGRYIPSFAAAVMGFNFWLMGDDSSWATVAARYPSRVSSVRIAKVPGVTVTRWQRIWGERFPRIPLEVADVTVAGQRAALIERSVDMCFARLPIDREGLHAIALYEEEPVVWLSKDHVLAELDELTTADLVDERVLVEATPEAIDLATYSAAVLCVPMSIARSGSRKDLVHRRLVDGERSAIALVWRIDDDNPLIDEFIGIVRGRTPNSSRSQRERAGTGRPAQSRGELEGGVANRSAPDRRPARRRKPPRTPRGRHLPR